MCTFFVNVFFDKCVLMGEHLCNMIAGLHKIENEIKLRVQYGQVSMKDGKILNFHKVFLAWSNIW